MKTLVVFLVSLLLVSCKSVRYIPLETKEETTIRVNHREIPVLTPEKDITVWGKITVDRRGFPVLGDVSIASDGSPDIRASMDSLGNLRLDVSIPSDTVLVTANDSIMTTSKSRIEQVTVEREFTWWQKALMYVGSLLIVYIIVIFVTKLKNM